MVHGYHVIWGTYGFWLPNDPRGSWSDFVASWELARFGKATGGGPRRDVDRGQWARWRESARHALKYPTVTLTGQQAKSAGTGFAKAVATSGYTIWACSMLPEHVHLVIARHRYDVETIANLLKGAATKRLKRDGLHPQAAYQDKDGKSPQCGARRSGRCFWIRKRRSSGQSATSKKTRLRKANRGRRGRSSRRFGVSCGRAGQHTIDSFTPEPTATACAGRESHRGGMRHAAA